MSKLKSTANRREADLTAARKAGGNNAQSHWFARLTAVMKQRAKAEKKANTR
jgi:hypothetical protein